MLAKKKKFRRGTSALTLDDVDLFGTGNSSRRKRQQKKKSKKKKSERGALDGPDMDTEDEDEKDDDTTDFPKERAKELGLLSPNKNWRFYLDFIVLILMLYVLYVTPFELSFIQTSPRFGALWVCNVIVDVGFLIEIFIGLNTAYFDKRRHAWVLSRKKIFRRYARLWLWIDFVALMRWEYIIRAILGGGGGDVAYRYFRLVRLAKLIRLIRILKAPEIMSRIAQKITLSHKTNLVLQAIFALISLLHFEACVIRTSHTILRHKRRNLEITTFLSTPFRLYRGKFKQGNFALYIDSLDWAVQTLLGQSMYTNTTEAVLSIFNNLLGLLIVSFLIGEVANVLCNLDPARNEFHQTSDMLNNYMREHDFPSALRWKLHLYLSHSEDLFRSRFHDALVQRLSPPLQELVAHFMLGKRVLQAPFFGYARQVTFGLVTGRRIWVKPPRRRGGWRRNTKFTGRRVESNSTFNDDNLSDASSSDIKISSFSISSIRRVPQIDDTDDTDDENEEEDEDTRVRSARIIRLHPQMQYDVRYDDDESVEYELSHSRISLEHEPVEIQRAMQSVNHVTKLIVSDFARAMKMNLYNGGDYICRKNVSRSNRICIVDKGTVLAFGIDIAKPFHAKTLREGGCFGDGELARISAGHHPLLSWYNARASEMTRLLMLKSEDFLDIISTPGYEHFHKCIIRYGRWINLKISVCTALKNKTLHSLFKNGYQSLIDSKSTQLTKLDEAKRAQALMVGAASTHFERLLAMKLADHSEHVDELVKDLTTEFSERDAARAKQVEKLQAQLNRLEAKLDSNIITKLDLLTATHQQRTLSPPPSLSDESTTRPHIYTSTVPSVQQQGQLLFYPVSPRSTSASPPPLRNNRSNSSLREFVVG